MCCCWSAQIAPQPGAYEVVVSFVVEMTAWQNTVESATFGADMVAMRVARDLTVALRIKLKSLEFRLMGLLALLLVRAPTREPTIYEPPRLRFVSSSYVNFSDSRVI